MATEKRVKRIGPDWYDVGPAQVLAAGSSITVNFNILNKIISDAKTLGKTPYVHAIAIVMNHSGTLAASGAGADASVADIQRGCFYEANWQQPNIKESWFSVNPRLSFMRQVGLMVNPTAVALDRLIQSSRRMFNSLTTSDVIVPSGSIVPSPDVDVRPSLVAGWRDDTNWQAVSATVATPFDFVDVFTVPMCKSTTGGFYNDKLPLTMIADPANPWQLLLSEVTAGGHNIRTDLFKTTAHTVEVQVKVYVSFVDENSTLSVGVQWSCNQYSFQNNTPLPAHYHVAIIHAPDYNSTTVDGATGLAVPYLPTNYQDIILNDTLRTYDCQVQVWPLNTASEVERQIVCFNIGAGIGERPFALYDQNKTSTLYVPSTSTIVGPEVASWLGATGIGVLSSMPFFPVLVNNMLTKGFLPNIMAKPGCSVDHRVTLEGPFSLPTTNFFDIYIAEHDSDRQVAMSYAMYGNATGSIPQGAFKPLIANEMSPYADTAKDIVPWVMER